MVAHRRVSIWKESSNHRTQNADKLVQGQGSKKPIQMVQFSRYVLLAHCAIWQGFRVSVFPPDLKKKNKL